MGCGVLTIFAALLAAVAVADAVTLDLGLTKDIEQVVKKDNFIISLKHIKPRRKLRGTIETLFSVDFPGVEHKFTLLLDRKTKKVIVETLEDGRKRDQHFTVDKLHEDGSIRSLIFAVNQSQPGAHANLYIDCASYGMVATPKSMRDMYASMHRPNLEVFHEKKYPMEVEGHRDLRAILSKNGCPLELQTEVINYEEALGGYSSDLKDDPNIQGQQPQVYDVGRGDIPLISSVPNDFGIINALNELTKAVNEERNRCAQQAIEFERLRRYLEECDICRHQPPTPAPTPTCATNPPGCYPGVVCHDTPQGPRCGSCPRGYIGNGYDCRPGRTCADNPCYPGVRCWDVQESPGYRCDRCPSGLQGDGEHCTNPCDYNPCAPGTNCPNRHRCASYDGDHAQY